MEIDSAMRKFFGEKVPGKGDRIDYLKEIAFKEHGSMDGVKG